MGNLVTFKIQATKVGTYSVKVTATAQRSIGDTVTEPASKMLVVKVIMLCFDFFLAIKRLPTSIKYKTE